MRNKNFKGRSEKRALSKCKGVCRTFDAIQYAYADVLEKNENVAEFQCNVALDGLDIGEYMSDFVCITTSGDVMVRECVYKRLLLKPLTMKLLDASREYWIRRGAEWGIVVDEVIEE